MSVKRKAKFTFSDYRLSQLVRNNMEQALIKYDVDRNGLFSESQIVQALVGILDQNKNQLHYVVQNVFRYDKDNDKKVTTKQFIDFSVQQHFGQMAIQRLHKLKTYSQGNRRIMNLQQFIKTLDYSLVPIHADGDHQSLTKLFSQIDLDKDGFITYEDYFMFLKQYFGSFRIDADNNQKPSHPQPPAKNPTNPLDQNAGNKFAKLIYNQMKVQAMISDEKRGLSLTLNQAFQFLQRLLKNQNDANQIVQFIFNGASQISYEQFLLTFVPFYFCEYIIQVGYIQDNMNQEEFVNSFGQACANIVPVVPSLKTIRSIYGLFSNNRNSDTNSYVKFLGPILTNFQFDRRGLA